MLSKKEIKVRINTNGKSEGLNEGLGLAEAAGIPLDEVGETGFAYGSILGIFLS